MKHIIPLRTTLQQIISHAIALLFLLGLSQQAQAQDCDLACIGTPELPLQVVIDESCQVAVTTSMVVPDLASCPGSKRLTVRDSLNNLLADNFDLVQFAVGDLVGNRLSVTITDQVTGTICVGSIQVVDNNPPTITDCPEVTVSCLDSTAPEDLGLPTISDNCDDELELTFVDNLIIRDCLTDTAAIILRDWTVTDASNLSSTCTQQINILRASFMDVTFPGNTTLPCNDPSADPEITGIPQLNGTTLMHGDYCGLDVSFVDDTIFICNDYMYQIDRTWTVTETCTDFFGQETQEILVSDDQGPVLNCPPADQLVFTSDPGECGATIALPVITGTDNCGSNITFTVSSSYGADNFSPVSGVAPGTYSVTYTGTDGCGNVSSCSVQLTVVDDVTPVAACDDQTLVSISSSGYGIVLSQTFDEGSSDNCNAVFVKAKRNIAASCDLANGDDSPQTGFQEWFDDQVVFCCEDIAASPVTVTLRVYEVNPGDGPVDPTRENGNGDLVGHYTDCESIVTVQDGTAPNFVQCPAPVTIQCTDEQEDLSIYGSPIVQDNCGFTLDSTFTTSFNECGVGTITRTWTATDNFGQSAQCSQLITVENDNPLQEEDITWPADYILYECGASTDIEDLPEEYQGPIINYSGCGTVALNHSDALFNTVPGACYKVLRTWTIIDWCHFNPEDLDGAGRFQHTQQVKVFDIEDPVITCPEPVSVNIGDNCTDTFVTIGEPTAEDCSTQITFNNSSPHADDDGIDASGTYPVGTTNVTFYAEDNCGNNTACTTTVTVGDTEPPSIACIVGLTTNLMPVEGGGVNGSIDAVSLVASAVDNCSPTNLLKYTISRPGDGTIGLPSNTSLTFDCYDANFVVEVMVWAEDTQGNYANCTTIVTVQDPNDNCVGQTGEGLIAGGVLTEDGEEVENVIIRVSGNSPEMMYTELDGSFMFDDLELGLDYSIVAQLDENILNGVTTMDLILISKHILGTRLLDSPYKLIAADVDRSGHISTLDIIKLRKLILNIDNALPNNNTSWRFVDASYEFLDPTNPFMGYFPEFYNINDLAGPEMYVDFIAIKVGDVNGSAIPNSISSDDDNRSSGNPLELSVAAQEVEAGETVDIDFTARYMNEWMGYQFTLEYAPSALEIIEIEAGSLPNLYPEENFHIYDERAGLITAVWNEYGGSANSKEQIIFTVKARAKENGNLKDWLYMSSRVTKSEAYTQEGETEEINLSFFSNNETTTDSNFELFQNRPNPWNNSTIIPFQLDPGGDARLTVYDMAGKLVYEVANYFPEGYHEISISRTDLPAIGLFYYTLEAGEQRATRKMVLTD
ncbi:MAG: HYR domain-containing protein [Bacteroidota bacterium]